MVAAGAALTIAACAVVASADARTSTSSAQTAKSYVLSAALNAHNTVPAAKGAAAARGTFTGKLTLAGKKSTFVWQLKFSGLTGRATAAHLHLGVAGKSGALALTICGPCKSSVQGSYTGSYVAEPGFVSAVLHGGMYADIHTTKNPKGEIRGQIKTAAA
jgi:hypothetical protein